MDSEENLNQMHLANAEWMEHWIYSLELEIDSFKELPVHAMKEGRDEWVQLIMAGQEAMHALQVEKDAEVEQWKKR